MAKTGPIIIIEDDIDDQEMLKEVFETIGVTNELRFFDNGLKALEHLRVTLDMPFLILTDVNLPVMNGIELRREIIKDENLRKKSIPYIFLSTSDDMVAIRKVYDMQVQGYFIKQNSYAGILNLMKMIVEYWKTCKHPNSY